LLAKDTNSLGLIDSARLRAIYKELLQRMEKWFELKVSDEVNQFDVEIIKLKRLLDDLDMNELLVLIEFILDILMRCERQQELVERIVSISDQA
jgi:hypothetical protein